MSKVFETPAELLASLALGDHNNDNDKDYYSGRDDSQDPNSEYYINSPIRSKKLNPVKPKNPFDDIGIFNLNLNSISPGNSPVKNTDDFMYRKNSDYDSHDNNLYHKDNKTYIKKYCYKSQAGKNDHGKTKTNQDTYVVITKLLDFKNYNIFGVLDGHGNNGHFASQAINNFYTEYFQRINNYNNISIIKKSHLSSNKLRGGKKQDANPILNQNNINEEILYNRLKENNYAVIRNAFQLAEHDLSISKFDVNFSGSTSVIVLILSDKVICANAGDSRAVIVTEMKGKNTSIL